MSKRERQDRAIQRIEKTIKQHTSGTTLTEKILADKELKKRIAFEKNQQLNRFSKIYFNKVKKNSTISE